MVVVGVDAHKRTHTLVAIDNSGRKLGEKTASTTDPGLTEAIAWVLERFGPDTMWALEDSRTYTMRLEQRLLKTAPWKVVRCPPHLMARTRRSSREYGKSDPIDALAVARTALREPDLPAAVHDRVSWELRQLVEWREHLVAQRVGVILRLYEHLHLIDPAAPTPNRLDKRIRREALAQQLRTTTGFLAEIARDELDEIEYLSRRIDTHTARVVSQIDDLNSSLLTIAGCAHLTAAKLIGEAANADRFRSADAFAMYSGVAPIPAWSGNSAGRLRTCPGGNRQINAALHRIAIIQLARPGLARTYVQRRRDAGDSGRTAVRRLKRHLSRVVFNRLRADYLHRQNSSADSPPAAYRDDSEHPPVWSDVVTLADQLDHDDPPPRRRRTTPIDTAGVPDDIP